MPLKSRDYRKIASSIIFKIKEETENQNIKIDWQEEEKIADIIQFVLANNVDILITDDPDWPAVNSANLYNPKFLQEYYALDEEG